MARLLYTLCSVVALSVTSYGSDALTDNLLTIDSLWSATTDEFGSSLDTGSALVNRGVATVTFNESKQVGDEDFTYCELFSATGSLTGGSALELTYKATKPLFVKIGQSDFSDAGDNSYAFFEKELPASAEYSSITIPLKDFKLPEWATQAQHDIGLKPENCSGIYFNTPENFVGIATYSIKSLVLVR